jgi:hypothetical protein
VGADALGATAAFTTTVCGVDPVLYVLAVTAGRATSNWIRALDGNQTSNSEISLINRNQVISKQAYVQSKELTKEEFNVPLNGVEHKTMVAKLRLGGLSENEADQTVSLRKTA